MVASAGWKTRIVTLYQSPWQTCRRRDSDPGDHFVALGGQVKMPSGEVDRFQQVGILRQIRRRGPTNPEEPLQALAYGHCGKKFAPKVPGEVSQVPPADDDSETFV